MEGTVVVERGLEYFIHTRPCLFGVQVVRRVHCLLLGTVRLPIRRPVPTFRRLGGPDLGVGQVLTFLQVKLQSLDIVQMRQFMSQYLIDLIRFRIDPVVT